jgi:hypothetical protein
MVEIIAAQLRAVSLAPKPWLQAPKGSGGQFLTSEQFQQEANRELD